jgi:HECT-domain (ubiquitin-transferase)
MIDTKWLRYVTDVCSVDNRGLTLREIDSMFNQQEVQILLGGVNSPVDLEDLRKHTNYGGLYDDKEETITTFWNVSSRTSDSLSFIGY